MKEEMNYTLMPSLELQARIKTAVILWNQDDIRAITTNFCFKISSIGDRQEEWQQVEDKVKENVQDLPLPETLKKKVSGIIKPIGFEILKYKTSFKNIDARLVRENISNSCWTPKGTIDRKKAAEAFVRDETLGILKRYGLACTNCFQNDILTLLNKINDYRRIYHNNLFQTELVVFWTNYIKGEVTRINNEIERKWQGCTPYQYAFELAASDGNKVATEYFFQKLTSEEREESLVRSAGYACHSYRNQSFLPFEDHAGVLCFLLSQMNEEQQVEVLKNHPFSVLKCFLYWPCQDFFMETAKRMWAFLPEGDYNSLLNVIINLVVAGDKDYNYQKLFRVFWQQSPRTHKQYVIDQCAEGFFLLNLLQAKDKENIKLILEYATSEIREKIIFSRIGIYACGKLLNNDEMDLLEFFVQECISSKDIMIKFREKFERILICSVSKDRREKEKYLFNKFYQLINNLIQKDDESRSLEEGSSDPSKRVCSFTNEELRICKAISEL